jgi:hypothetical protein
MAAQSTRVERLGHTGAEAARLYSEGLIAGTLGAAMLALWFLLIDVLQGQPLYTPMVLGTMLFKGGAELATLGQLPLSVDILVGFTFLHWLVFVALGGIAAWLLDIAEGNANAGFGILLLFVMVMFGFFAVAAVVVPPLLQVLRWQAILIGNLLAVLAMGLYLWWQHRHMTVYP